MHLWLWATLICIITVLATVEFTLLARRPRVIQPAEALAGTGIWLVAAALFAWVIYVVYNNNWLGIESLVSAPLDNVNLDGPSALLQFVTVYIAEVALSLDNIAVLTVLLAFYNVQQRLVARVLFWAVTASLVLRLLAIVLFGSLAAVVDWLHYVFAGLLVVAVVRTLLLPDPGTDRHRVGQGAIPRLISRLIPVSDRPHGMRLTTTVPDASRPGGVRWALTPLTVVVLVVALSDVTYAADFLPAALSITQDPFIAFAGNAFALLTLRSLFFTIAPFMGRFRFLKLTLAFIMLYIAVNTFFFHQQRLAAEITLGVIAGALGIGVLGSVLVNRRAARAAPPVGGRLAKVVGQRLLYGDSVEYRPAPIDDLREAAAATRRNFKKVLILIAGTAVIVAGILIAPLPGPGFTVLAPLGIAILASEFIWAKRLMDQLKDQGQKLAVRSDSFSRRIPFWLAVVFVLAWPAAWYALWRWATINELKFLSTFIMATAFGLSFPFGVWAWRRFTGRYKRSALTSQVPMPPPTVSDSPPVEPQEPAQHRPKPD